MLTSQQIEQIKLMEHDELLRSALTPDMGVLVEVSYRLNRMVTALHRATLWLNGILIALTIALVYFAFEASRHSG